MARDNLCKLLAERHPAAFAAWLLGRTVAEVELLKTELPREALRPDFVCRLPGERRILHVEFNVTPTGDPPLPQRLAEHAVLLFRRHPEDELEQVLVLLRQTGQVVPEEFRRSGMVHRFRVMKLWEQPAGPLLAQAATLPLAVLARGEPTPLALLERVARELERLPADERRREEAAYAEILAGLRFDKAAIHRILRLSVMEESVIYQEIIEQGVKRGAITTRRQDVFKVVKARFGEVPYLVQEEINRATQLTQLEALLLRAATASSLKDFSAGRRRA